MGRKAIRNLRAKVSDGCVHLSFFRRPKADFIYEPADSLPPCLVYRKQETDFVWGEDGLEYFDGLDHRRAEVVYRGPLPLVGPARGEFVDSTVAAGCTYAYWMALDNGEPPTGPVGVGVYDPGVWWPQAETERRLEALAAGHGDLVRLKVYGQTVMGRPLRALIAGAADNLLAAVGTFHAGESGPELLVPAVERLLARDAALLKRAGIAILPSVNIDSRQRIVEGHPAYLRKNARGVDLNRNCPARWEVVSSGYGLSSDDPQSATYRGPAPASEPETRAVLAFLRDVRPRVVFSYHWLASICGTVMLPPNVPSSPESAAACEELGQAYARGFYGDPERGPELQPSEGAGSLVAWVNEELGVPAFCIESPDKKYDPEDKAASGAGLTTPELLKKYQARHYGALGEVMRRLAGQQGR